MALGAFSGLFRADFGTFYDVGWSSAPSGSRSASFSMREVSEDDLLPWISQATDVVRMGGGPFGVSKSSGRFRPLSMGRVDGVRSS